MKVIKANKGFLADFNKRLEAYRADKLPKAKLSPFLSLQDRDTIDSEPLTSLTTHFNTPNSHFTIFLESNEDYTELCIDIDDESNAHNLLSQLEIDGLSDTFIHKTIRGIHIFYQIPTAIFTPAKSSYPLMVDGVGEDGQPLAQQIGEVLTANHLVFGSPLLIESGVYRECNGLPVKTLTDFESFMLLSILQLDADKYHSFVDTKANIGMSNENKRVFFVEKSHIVTDWINDLNRNKMMSSKTRQTLVDYILPEVGARFFKSTNFNQFSRIPIPRNGEVLSNRLMFSIILFLLEKTDTPIADVLHAAKVIDATIFTRPLQDDGKFDFSPARFVRYRESHVVLKDGKFKDIKDELKHSKDAKISREAQPNNASDLIYTTRHAIGLITDDGDCDVRATGKGDRYAIIKFNEDFTEVERIRVYGTLNQLNMVVRNDAALQAFCYNDLILDSSKMHIVGSQLKVNPQLMSSIEIRLSPSKNFNQKQVTIVSAFYVRIDYSMHDYHPRLRYYERTIANTRVPSDEEFNNFPVIQFIQQNIFPNSNIFTAWMWSLREAILRKKPMPFAFVLLGVGGLGKTSFPNDFMRHWLCNTRNPATDSPLVYKKTIRDTINDPKKYYLYASMLILMDEMGVADRGASDLKIRQSLNDFIKELVRQEYQSGDKKYGHTTEVLMRQLGIYVTDNTLANNTSMFADNTRLVFSACKKIVDRLDLSEFLRNEANEHGDEILTYILTNDKIDEDMRKIAEVSVRRWDDSALFSDGDVDYASIDIDSLEGLTAAEREALRNDLKDIADFDNQADDDKANAIVQLGSLCNGIMNRRWEVLSPSKNADAVSSIEDFKDSLREMLVSKFVTKTKTTGYYPLISVINRRFKRCITQAGIEANSSLYHRYVELFNKAINNATSVNNSVKDGLHYINKCFGISDYYYNASTDSLGKTPFNDESESEIVPIAPIADDNTTAHQSKQHCVDETKNDPDDLFKSNRKEATTAIKSSSHAPPSTSPPSDVKSDKGNGNNGDDEYFDSIF